MDAIEGWCAATVPIIAPHDRTIRNNNQELTTFILIDNTHEKSFHEDDHQYFSTHANGVRDLLTWRTRGLAVTAPLGVGSGYVQNQR